MPTQRLIDINTAAITYRTKCLMALDKHMYRNCIGAINSMNALLPADEDGKCYRIIINTEEYEKKINSSFIMVCRACEVEHEYDKITILNLLVSSDEWIVTGEKRKKIWVCPNCKVNNVLSSTRIIESSFDKPYYYRYIPEAPVYKTGLLSQLEFHNKMVDWVWNALTNIEEGFSRFRDDNWSRGGENFDEFGIDNSLDDNEKP